MPGMVASGDALGVHSMAVVLGTVKQAIAWESFNVVRPGVRYLQPLLSLILTRMPVSISMTLAWLMVPIFRCISIAMEEISLMLLMIMVVLRQAAQRICSTP